MDFLETIKDEGSDIDTGYCFVHDTGELVVSVGGADYLVSVERCAPIHTNA